MHVVGLEHLKPNSADVRFASKADIGVHPINVCFTPKSGHWLSVSGCPLRAKSGHYLIQPALMRAFMISVSQSSRDTFK